MRRVVPVRLATILAYNEAALLADEMGLGKTVQAIVALRVILCGSVSRRALIITPASWRLAPGFSGDGYQP